MTSKRPSPSENGHDSPTSEDIHDWMALRDRLIARMNDEGTWHPAFSPLLHEFSEALRVAAKLRETALAEPFVKSERSGRSYVHPGLAAADLEVRRAALLLQRIDSMAKLGGLFIRLSRVSRGAGRSDLAATIVSFDLQSLDSLPGVCESVCFAIEGFIAMATDAAANLKQVLAAIQNIGALEDSVFPVTLVAACLDVLLVVERPEPVFVTPVAFFDRSRSATVGGNWTPSEVTVGPSLWGHDRAWLPPEQREQAREMRLKAAAQGTREPLYVIDGNYRLMEGVCPWWDAAKRT